MLVTGASSGLGIVFAREIAAEASTLVLVARRRDRLEALRDELVRARPALCVLVEPCDLADPEELEALLARLDAAGVEIDVLVNNAGFGDLSLLESSDWDKLDRMIRVNVVAPTRLARAVFPRMIERGRGGILAVSSGFGLVFFPGYAVYVGTKHYLTSFTESLRLEATGTGVVVTQVCPGPVATEFDAVANLPTGWELPAFARTSPETAVRSALRAFRRNRALVVPGLHMKVSMLISSMAPRGLHRLVLAPLARLLRTRLRRARATR